MTNIIDQVKAAQEAATRSNQARARAEHELGVAEANRQAVEQQLQTEFGISYAEADSALAGLEGKLNAELELVRQQLAGAQGG